MPSKKLQDNIFQSIPLTWGDRAKKAGHSIAALSRACDLSYETVGDAAKGANITLKNAILIENKLCEWGV